MRTTPLRVLTSITLAATALIAAPAGPPALAQTRSAQVEVQVPVNLQDAQTTREELRRLLGMHPTSLGRILKLDPQLMLNEAYLAPYPALADFLKRHPEVPRNPAYFLNFIDSWGNMEDPVPADQQTRREAINFFRNTFGEIVFFLVFLTVTYTIVWLVRYVISHRRWIRATKVQAEVHGRLLERLSSNEELMAYVQSSAGSHFLMASPIADAGPSPEGAPVAAPFGRILWAVQAGLVLASGGVGLLIIRRYVMPEVGDMLLTLGVLAVSLGVGFALASGASYVISRRLGLIDQPRPAAVRDYPA
jgi:hypothetical protein